MSDQRIRIGSVVLILLISIWALIRTSEPMEAKTARIQFPNGVVVTAGVAQTQAERSLGLSGHAPLLENEGLLFLFEKDLIPSFWMKDMLFPIDIIWIAGDRVEGFAQQAQPETPPTTYYKSKSPVNRVLEVSAGFVADNQVKVGDQLDIELPSK